MQQAIFDTYWHECSFVVVDVEGNGQTPQEIIELAIVPIVQAHIVEPPREWLVRPSKPISQMASKIHGIFDDDLKDKPAFELIAHDVEQALGQRSAVIGHNVAIDVRLLKVQLPSWRPIVAIDTLKLAKRVLPATNNYALSALIADLGIGKDLYGGHHRAAHDSLATARLFLALVKILDKSGDLRLKALAEISAPVDDPFFTDAQRSLF